MKNSVDKILSSVYISLLAGIFCVFIFSCTGFIFHIPVNPFYLPISGIISLLIFIKLSSKYGIKPKTIVKTVILTSFLILLFGAISYLILDTSWDGRAYHQCAIVFLKNGWNPIYDNIYTFSKNLYNDFFRTPDMFIWVAHYTKFSEIFASNIYAVTGKIETGKIINYLFSALTFISAYLTLNRIQKRTGTNIILALIIVLNPVVICQTNTYYVDGLLYLAFVNTLFSIVSIILTGSKLNLLSLVMSLVILANIKTSGLFYGIFILLAWFVFLCIKKEYACIKTKFLPAVCAFSVFIIISGVNPYLLNIKEGGHILYPHAGKNKIDILTPSTPEVLQGRNSIRNLIFSTFCAESNNLKETKLKFPFTIKETGVFSSADVRIGGFGYFWSGILLLSLAVLAFLRFENKKNKEVFLFLLTVLAISYLAHPVSWWARYVAQAWCIPVIISAYALYENKTPVFTKKLAGIVIVIMFLNSFLVLFDSMKYQAKTSRKITKYLNRINKNSTAELYYDNKKRTVDVSYIIKLEEKGIEYRFVDTKAYNKGCFEPIVDSLDKRLFIKCGTY